MRYEHDMDRAIITDRERRDIEKRREEHERAERIREAAPQLYEACKDVRGTLKSYTKNRTNTILNLAIGTLEAALAAAEKGE